MGSTEEGNLKSITNLNMRRCLNCGCSEYAEDRNGEKLTNLIGTNCKNWDVTKVFIL